ncbi:MAG: PEP-CTERM sorting domain-containing protein [Rubrivivax sp.]|nr:MAG: PEP-CTERM sorting domain-containing protein [Rubrivivax sp.]
MRLHRLAQAAAAAFVLSATTAHAGIDLIAIGSLGGTSDLSGLSGVLESGLRADVLGGIGSGLAWAGGDTFLVLPDRGPNATSYQGGSAVDNTTSYIPRFHTVSLGLTASASGGLPYTLTPTLNKTTLLYSATALNYGSTAGLPSGVPTQNTAGQFYFTGRSDGFSTGNSLTPSNARFDPEALRVSADGKSVFVSDEYGPYIYQFNRATGERIKTFALPTKLAAPNQNAQGAIEISGNTVGRVANKGMEGLAISPDGKTLVGFMQSPLAQDGGDGGRANRIVTVDIATGQTHEYAYDNIINGKAYNSSEILALNDHQFLVLERDGKGQGDGSSAKVKQVWAVDLAGAQDVGNLSGEAALLAKAPSKTLFLDIAAALKGFGVPDTQIPAKLEGLSFGQDIVENGVTKHTLYIANDNDFVPGVAGSNRFYVFAFTDAELANQGLSYERQSIAAAVPEPESFALLGAGLAMVAWVRRRR